MATAPPDIRYPSTEHAACPFPLYSWLQEEAPVYELPDRPGVYMVTRFEDLVTVARDTETFSSVESRSGLNPFDHLGRKGPVNSIIESDPPEHKRTRDMCFDPFKPGRLKSYEPTITRFVDELIDAFEDAGEVEFVDAFAKPLPIKVICWLLGIPEADRDLVEAWGNLEVSGLGWMPPERQEQQLANAAKMAPYLTEKLLERKENPGDDVLSHLIQRQIEADGEFNLEWLLAQSAILLAGGVITTAHAISSAMLLLIDHPEHMAAVRADHALIPNMVEEALRLESPVQWVPRRVTRETELGGVTLPEGSYVLLMWGAANRDRREWEDAEAFKLGRRDVMRHMAFGLGPHFCLGAPLARLESRIAFERLLTRLDDFQVVDRDGIEPIDSPSFRGLRALPLTFRKATA